MTHPLNYIHGRLRASRLELPWLVALAVRSDTRFSGEGLFADERGIQNLLKRVWVEGRLQFDASAAEEQHRREGAGRVKAVRTQMYVKQVEMAADCPLVVSVEPSWRRSRCGTCGERVPRYDRQPVRDWRHLS